jgi:hypothetical protein
MGAVSDVELLPGCAEFTLSHSRAVEGKIIEELQTSAATRLIMGLRTIRLQRAILAIGMFSLFEALLQSHMGWRKPFDRLVTYLEGSEERALARSFNQYRLAINVLKHGEGLSYDQLLAVSSKLEFKIRPKGEPFLSEGDVSEVGVLVYADEAFVQRCAALIAQASAIIREGTEGLDLTRPH